MFNQNRIYRIFQLINYLKAAPAKTTASIERFLDTSGRTVYRYLDLLEELGFQIEKDEKGRLFINGSTDAEMIPFTAQEADFLKKLVQSAGKQHKLSAGVLQKLQRFDEITSGSNSLFNAHLSKIVETISIAIMERKQIKIKGYHSANSETISNRIIEPMKFTDDYTSLSAFEIATRSNKYFNIERMTEVRLLNQKMKFESLHQFFAPDCFGFQGKDMNKEIEMELSMRAYLLLKEQYPMCASRIQTIPGNNKFLLTTRVQSFKAPGRFAIGLPEEVKVIGSAAFKKYVSKETHHSSVIKK